LYPNIELTSIYSLISEHIVKTAFYPIGLFKDVILLIYGFEQSTVNMFIYIL